MPRASRNPAELLPPQDHLCLVGVPDRLQDRSALGLYHRAIHPVCGRFLQVGQRLGEAMEGRQRSGTRKERDPLGRGMAHQVLRQSCSPLPIRDPAKQVPAEQEQFNQVDLGPGRETAALS